jgi:hypothetical protein
MLHWSKEFEPMWSNEEANAFSRLEYLAPLDLKDAFSGSAIQDVDLNPIIPGIIPNPPESLYWAFEAESWGLDNDYFPYD